MLPQNFGRQLRNAESQYSINPDPPYIVQADRGGKQLQTLQLSRTVSMSLSSPDGAIIPLYCVAILNRRA